MERLAKVKLYFTFDFNTKLILMEAYLYLGWAHFILKRPFKKVAPSLGTAMEETTFGDKVYDVTVVKHVSSAIRITSRHTFWDSKCLVQAVAGMKMLERRGIDSTLYMGTKRDSEGKMIAHAWLRSGSLYVSGDEVMKGFTVVNKFAKTTRVKGRWKKYE